MRAETGHIDPFWDKNFKNFCFKKQKIKDSEIKKWKSMGYDHVKSFSGSMYDNKNPMPDWISDLEHCFGLRRQTYTFYRMDTLEIMPVHSDHFSTYCKLNNTTSEYVERVVLMLEDWKPGHYFELDGVGYVNWKAGDWFKWQGDVPHSASNIGTEPRYTLQITGIPALEGQLNKLFFKNIPGIDENINNSGINDSVLSKINTHEHVMLYMNNRHIKELDDIVHDDSAVDTLNKNGLDIYLYEPLCSYHIEFPEHNNDFYSEFKHPVNPDDLRSEELDSIYKYAKRNNLSNVNVHSCDYDIANWYTYYTDTLNLYCNDLFLKTLSKVPNSSEQFVNRFMCPFVCMNWRFTKHRQLLATFLANEDGYLSWYHTGDFASLSKNLAFDFNEWSISNSKHYNRLKSNSELVVKNAPFYIDIPANNSVEYNGETQILWPETEMYKEGETPALYNHINGALLKVYNNAFIDIVNETRYAQPTANISEKVMQAIQYKKPFIVVAPPKTLEYIRSLGFRTFNEFWDESYDDELDHGKRLAKIFDLIEKILSMTLKEQRHMNYLMREITIHNLQCFEDFIGSGEKHENY